MQVDFGKIQGLFRKNSKVDQYESGSKSDGVERSGWRTASVSGGGRWRVAAVRWTWPKSAIQVLF